MTFDFRAGHFLPAAICVSYYLIVFLIAEISRKIVDLSVSKKSLLYKFMIELIGTAQMCTCVYENGIIIQHYGASGFFIVVFGLLTIGSIINRDAYVSPLAPIEMFYRKMLNTEKFLLILTAQTLGGISAFRFANTLWYYSINYSVDHLQSFERLPCTISYKVSFIYVILFEIVGSFLLRFIFHRIHLQYKKYIVPTVVSSFLCFAFVYIGVPGLNPVVTSSRLQGCSGLDLQWFIITYWCCPVVGWLLATKFDKKLSALRKSKKAAKKKN